MKTVWKYPVPLDQGDKFSFNMPLGAEVLCLQNQFETPTMWTLVDNDEPMEDRNFQIVGTGHEASRFKKMEYIGTFQLSGGVFVFHLFEV